MHVQQHLYKANSAAFLRERTMRHWALAAGCTNVHTQPLSYAQAIRSEDAEAWTQAAHEEYIRLVVTTGTGSFVPHAAKPKQRKASYYNPQLKVKMKNGTRIYRVRGTYGGDRGDFEGETAAYTASLTTIKVLLQSALSDDDDLLTSDISDYYLGSPMERPEYMRIQRRQIPQRTIDELNLEPLFEGDAIMMEVRKGIYGLKQAGKLAQDRLFAHLAQHDYILDQNTSCLFRHKTRPIAFTLVVDDFLIKSRAREHTDHLLGTLHKLYRTTEDWSASKYLGMTIARSRAERTLTLSMPEFLPQMLARLNYDWDGRKAHSPLHSDRKIEELNQSLKREQLPARRR